MIQTLFYNTETGSILLESDEKITTTNSNNISLAKTTDIQSFILIGKNENYEIQNRNNAYLDFVKKSGFIQIDSQSAVNPDKIKAFKTKSMEIEIDNHQILPVNNKYKKGLIEFITKQL
jgi:DNA-binding LytR/AlgR family response regulator